MSKGNVRAMTKSGLALARETLCAAGKVLPAYSGPYSPKKFTQPQLLTILVVRKFLKQDYRGMEQMLRDWSDLRKVLGLKRIPDHSTLEKAEARLLKKGLSTGCLTRPSALDANAA